MKIGIFDSGKGGEFVAIKFREMFPEHEFLVVNDREHMPYGDRKTEEICELTNTAIQPLLNKTKIIIIACNTATTAAIEFLREKYPSHKFIGFEPAVKPAAQNSRTGNIMILATPATLKSAKHLALKNNFAKNVKVLEPETTATWAEKIENDAFREEDLTAVVELARQYNVDEIVLGCTHYLAVEQALREKLPAVEIVESVTAVGRMLEKYLREK